MIVYDFLFCRVQTRGAVSGSGRIHIIFMILETMNPDPGSDLLFVNAIFENI